MLSEDAVRATFTHIYDKARNKGFNVKSCSMQAADDEDYQEHLHMQWLLTLSPTEVRQDAITGRDRLIELSEILRDHEYELSVGAGSCLETGQSGRATSFRVADTPISSCVILILLQELQSKAEFN